MSSYRELKTQIKDKDCLVKALEEKGKIVEVHDEPVSLIDYVGKTRPQKAEIVIRRKNVGGAANDIGFAKQADGTYQAIISENEVSCGYNDKWLNDLKDKYGVHKIKKLAKQQGLSFVSTKTNPNGEIEMIYKQVTA